MNLITAINVSDDIKKQLKINFINNDLSFVSYDCTGKTPSEIFNQIKKIDKETSILYLSNLDKLNTDNYKQYVGSYANSILSIFSSFNDYLRYNPIPYLILLDIETKQKVKYINNIFTGDINTFKLVSNLPTIINYSSDFIFEETDNEFVIGKCKIDDMNEENMDKHYNFNQLIEILNNKYFIPVCK